MLSDEDFQLIEPYLEPVDLPRQTILAEPNRPIDNLYFLEEGLASQIALGEDGRKLEVGIYGREGAGPMALLLGVDRTPHLHIIQLGGHGLRISAHALMALMDKSRSLRRQLLAFVYVSMVQTAHTAFSNASSLVGERLARWLLMCHDRVDGDDIAVTHEFLGVMLGVRRTGVTDAIHILEGVGMVRGRRGLINIRDRIKLEETAGETYGVPESEYLRLLGPMRRPA